MGDSGYLVALARKRPNFFGMVIQVCFASAKFSPNFSDVKRSECYCNFSFLTARVFDFIENNPNQFDADKIYAEGFSQNSMFSAYTAFCFHDKVLGVWQGGSGLTLTGERPFVPNKGAQCSMSSFVEYGGQCMEKDPCTTCQYWPIYPCYKESRPTTNRVDQTK